MSELKERFGNDKVAFIRFGFFLGSRFFFIFVATPGGVQGYVFIGL